jgi:2-polyprenyl-3-methyl-5-hydroxy-6-metoxy-1,4-benzoquinol methylase
MKKEHLKKELQFYKQAFSNNRERRKRKYSWQYAPSKSVVELVKRNKLISKASFGRVLDVGCGDGRHIEYFRKLGFSVWGVDFSKEAIDLCRKRFRGDSNVHLKIADLTRKNVLKSLGKFDVVIDWSVLDHIRMKYRKVYLNNLIKAIREGGYAILTEFDTDLPGIYSNRKYKISRGHYSRVYSITELKKILRPLKLFDKKAGILEDEINNYRFNTVLFRN